MSCKRNNGRPICPNTPDGMQDCSDPRCVCQVKKFTRDEVNKATPGDFGPHDPEPEEPTIYDNEHEGYTERPLTVETAEETANNLRDIIEYGRERLKPSEHKQAREAMLKELGALERLAGDIAEVGRIIEADLNSGSMGSDEATESALEAVVARDLYKR